MSSESRLQSERERELEAEVAALRLRLAQLEADRQTVPTAGSVINNANLSASEIRNVQRERSLLQVVLDMSPFGILIVDRGHRITYASNRAAEVLGTSRDELTGQDAFDVKWDVHFEDGRSMAVEDSLYAKVMATGEPRYDASYRVRSGDGHTVWLSLSAAPLIDEAGSVDAVVLILQDVTARQQAEEGLRRAHRQLQLHLTNTPLAAIEYDADFRITSVNKRTEQMFGYSADEMVGRLRDEMPWVPLEYRSQVESRVRQVKEGVAEILGYNPCYRKDGSLVHCEWHISSLYDPEGRLQSVLVLGHDVTERLAAERALERQMDRYRTLVELALDPIYLLDGNGHLVEANQAFLDSLGYTREEVEGMHASRWNKQVRRGEDMGLSHATIHRPHRSEVKFRRKDGVLIDVEINACGVDLEGRRLVLAVARDITVRKLVERRRRKTLQKLERRVAEEVSRARASEQALIHQSRLASMGEMLERIAHQWRQPLNTLSMLLANLRDLRQHGELDDREMDDFMHRARLQVQQMSTTISDFIEFFRPDKEKVIFGVLERVESAVSLVAPSLGHQGIEVTVCGQPEVLTSGHPNEYAHVVLNLLSNARDAIVSQGLADGRVSISVTAEGAECRLTVADNGGGIPLALAERIFEPYFTTRVNGTGLGLYMSKNIIERVGGALAAQNEGPGAVFTISTPLAAKESRQ